jgi:glycerol-3-phosphate acyltransferase PlsY
MDPRLAAPLAILLSYLIGSIDFAVIVGRMHGVNIHQVGSGNPGASNVLRTLGKGPAIMVFVGDATKGLIAAAIGMFFTGQPATGVAVFAAGLAAVAGHCYPIFHRFRGGKGVATGGGVIFWTMPVVGVILTAIWALSAAATKTASVASMVVVLATIPLAIWNPGGDGVGGASLVVLGAMLALVVYRHRANISRIVARREGKVPT